MESLASPFPEPAQIDLRRFERTCAAAVAAAARAGGAAEAIEAALEILHEDLDGAGVAAFVVEHGRLWSVGVRGYAMIPDGLPLDEGVIGRAVRTSEVQLVLDVRADPDFVEVVARDRFGARDPPRAADRCRRRDQHRDGDATPGGW